MGANHTTRAIGSAVGRRAAIATVLLAALLALSAPASAQNAAETILKSMSDYVAGLKTISATFDTDIEVITPQIEKIQFTNSGTLLLSRPDKLRATRTGGYADVEMVFDGKTVSVIGKHLNEYASADAPGTIDQLVERLRSGAGVELPAADLLLSSSYDAMVEGVLEAKHIGQGVIDGVECEHLAFRAQETDWQIWIETGKQPIPRKYVITSKTVAAAPQYTLRIKEWKADAEVASDAFTFVPPAGAKKVDFAAMSNVDELPAGHVEGDTK